MGNRLYVGNLPYTIDENGIKEFFGEGCQVTQVRIITDRETKRPRGFAFVEVASAEQAASAITRLNGQQLGGRTIVVNEAREPAGGRPPRGDGPRQGSRPPRGGGRRGEDEEE